MKRKLQFAINNHTKKSSTVNKSNYIIGDLQSEIVWNTLICENHKGTLIYVEGQSITN